MLFPSPWMLLADNLPHLRLTMAGKYEARDVMKMMWVFTVHAYDATYRQNLELI